jgi:phosphate transport system permease protein
MIARRRRHDRLFAGVCQLATVGAVLLLGILLAGLIRDGIGRLSPQFLSSFPSRFPEQAGIKAALAGTLWVVGLTTVVAVPIGIGAALYLEEYAPKNRFTAFIQTNIANLAGVPSIVYALLGLAVFVRSLALGRSVLSGALTLALLILPMVIIATQEALRAVPRSLREASFGLGATRWQTITRQILPAASGGILTGIILAISRAAGETAPLVTIGAATFIAYTPRSLSDGFTALPIQIFNWAARPQAGFHQDAAAASLVLLAALLALNGSAIVLRTRAARHRIS